MFEMFELQQKMNRIRQSDGEFADIQCQIEPIDENFEDQYAEREIVENNFDFYLALANSVISRCQEEGEGSEKSRSAKSDRSHSEQSHNLNTPFGIEKFGKNGDDWNTLGEWEKYCDIKDIRDEPQFDDLKKFLLNRADFLERFEPKKLNESRESCSFEKSRNKSHSLVGIEVKCPVCDKQHNIQNCSNFLKMTSYNRLEKVKKLHLCINCLKSGHYTKQCRSTCCKTCGKKRHSSLHFENNSSPTNKSNSTGGDQVISSESNSSSNPVASTSTTCLSSHENRQILLSTALIEVQDSDGNWNVARALLDSGSQSCYITEALCSKLNLNKSKIDFAVSGLNNNILTIKSKSSVHFRSIRENYTKTISCYVLPTITGVNPNVPINTVELIYLQVYYWPIHHSVSVFAILHKTKLGYIVSGPITFSRNRVNTSLCCLATDTDVQTQLNKFWEVEEVDCKQVFVDEAIFIYEQVSKVLRSGCFELRKWLSNSEEIMTFISSCNTSEHSVKIGAKM
nr:unnamed protein product [Callosobruchus analis]